MKKRVATLSNSGAPGGAFPTSISSLAFSPLGGQLAIAASYGWEQGDPASLNYPPPPDSVFIRRIEESDARQRRQSSGMLVEGGVLGVWLKT